ncbi:MAG: hypothetical protein WCV79_02615 [Candidatus Paceibacterota bacterium]
MKTISFLVLSVVLMAGIVSAATTISNSISTGGTLTVTGTSTLMGNVGLGTSTPVTALDVVSESAVVAPVIVTNYSNTGGGGQITIRKARGTTASPSAISSGDQIAAILGQGFSGSSFSGNISEIGVKAAETFTSTANGTFMVFSTTGIGATTRSERMRIDGLGNIGIGIASPTALLHVSTTTPGMDVMKITAGTQNLVYTRLGNLGIGTTTPTTNLQVTTATANATSTITVGKINQNKGSCLELFDSAGTPVYAYVASGATTFTLSAVSCK